MNSNYNDVIDIILTLIDDEELSKYILISGSIVPYLISNEESKDNHSDLYIYVDEDKMQFVRKRLKELSKEYLFDIISDSRWHSKYDFGLKINYEDTIAGFFPFCVKNNELIIKTYAVNEEQKVISLKTKKIPEISKNSILKYINVVKNKILRVASPELILATAKASAKLKENYSNKTKELLNKQSDESILKVIEESVSKQKVNIVKYKIKKSDLITNIILSILLITLLILAYICFKK